MQRKNSFLRYSRVKSFRNGIAMIMAITVIVIMATIMSLSLAMTTLTSKKTIDLYLYEQSILLSKSATEYTLLQIANNPQCSELDKDILNFTQDKIYDINISIEYIYDSEDPCDDNGGTLYTKVETEEQSGSALIDVTVSVTDVTISSEPIRFFRRTLQKL
ncbi:MAG: hypothetical protein U9P38_09060 [Campylobacterota bacterium]|nr:hypothetical protein [Campylobacterota bacterium]